MEVIIMNENNNEQNSERNYPSTETLNILRNKAIWCFVGGLSLVACRFVAGKLVYAFGAGVIICALGVGWLMANNPVNKRLGAIIISIGILVMLSGVRLSVLPVITATMLSIISMGLLVMGIKNLIRYFVAQSKR
jgi:hypothetical protein